MSFYHKEPKKLNEKLSCARNPRSISNFRKNGGVPLYSHAHSFPEQFLKRQAGDVVTTPMGTRNKELYNYGIYVQCKEFR